MEIGLLPDLCEVQSLHEVETRLVARSYASDDSPDRWTASQGIKHC